MVNKSGLRRDARIIFTSLTLFTSFVLTTGAQQKPTVFRSGVDLRQLDVTVQDKNRRPVRGLTAADFSIEEDGKSQAIEAFSFVDLPDIVNTEPAWAATTVSDVATNDLESSRVFALVINDIGGMGDLWANREMKKSVATFVGELGPDDIASVIFPASGVSSQNFTRDKARLSQSVEWYGTRQNMLVGAIAYGVCTPPRQLPLTMRHVAETLASMKNRRKVIVYFGGGLNYHTGPDECGVGQLWQQVVKISNENNISIYPVDTMGLRPRPRLILNPFLELARETGGHAVVFTNSFDEGLKRIFTENSSYYLLAYQPTDAAEDGRFRRVIVKVNRKDVDVISTRSYWAPKAPTAKRPAPAPPSPEVAALAGVLPVSQMPLRAAAAAFRVDGSAAAVVTIALGLQQPAFPERTRETVDVLVRAFTPDGIDYGTEQQTVAVTVPAAPVGHERSRYQVLTRIDVPNPGRYELRISAHSAVTDTRGSIYVDVEVPDFRKEKLSLSGVLLSNALSTVPTAPPRVFGDITLAPPTTERAFAPSDPVTAFLRLYQGGNDRVAPALVNVKILDASGKAIFSHVEPFAADRFEASRSADYQLRLPLATLTTGDYLLTFEAAMGKISTKRDVRFQIR